MPRAPQVSQLMAPASQALLASHPQASRLRRALPATQVSQQGRVLQVMRAVQASQLLAPKVLWTS